MDKKKIITIVSLLVVLVVSCYAMNWTSKNASLTYDGSDVDVIGLYENPTKYDNSNPDGVAKIIVNTDLEKAEAVNDVASIVFDYRGFDTIGESFILLASIAGAHCILHSGKKKKEVTKK